MQAVTATFAAVRAGLTGAVTRAAAGFRDHVIAGQALLLAAVTAVVATVLRLASGVAATLTARVAQTISLVAGLVTSAVAAAQTGVRSVSGLITGLIDSVDLPDVPGIATIRAGAVAFLAGAAGVLTDTLTAVVAGVQAAARAAMTMVTTLVSSALTLVRSAVSRITTAVMRLVRTVASLLLRLAAGAAAALRLVLSTAVLPLLRRLELVVVGRLRWVLGHGLRLLRQNRNQQLASLAELEQGLPPPRGGATADPLDPETAADASRVVADAVTNSSRVVRLLDALTAGTARAVANLVRDIGALVLAEIQRRLGQALVRLLQVVATVPTVLRQVAAVVADMLRSMVAAVVHGVLVIIETVHQAVQQPLDALLSLAGIAVARILQAVIALATDLVLGTLGVTRDVRAIVLGEAAAPVTQEVEPGAPSEGGPVATVDPRDLPAILPVVQRGVMVAIRVAAATLVFLETAFFYAVVLYVAFEAVVVAGVGSLAAFLLSLGLSEFWVVLIIMLLIIFVVVVVVVIVTVLLILLFLLLRTLLRRRSRRRARRRVLSVNPAALELGVGGRTLPVTATIAPGVPPVPPLEWTVNPGATEPDGIGIIGEGVAVGAHADHPPHGIVTGGEPVVIRATLASDPEDFADSPGIMVVQVVEAHYDASPALGSVRPDKVSPPVNTVDPNRDAVSGSTAQVIVTTAPGRRPVRVVLRTPLGASASGTTITPGIPTGDIDVRMLDPATGAQLDEIRPALLNPPVLMSTLVVNAVPTRVTNVVFHSRLAAGPYSAKHLIHFESSDSLHPPLVRIVGELVTPLRDDFDLPEPNDPIGFNPWFDSRLAVPANRCADNLLSVYWIPNKTDGQHAIDVNRFVGPGVPGLPRMLIYTQRMVWAAWRTRTLASVPFAHGQQIRTLIQDGTGFRLGISQVLGEARQTPDPEPYHGNRLIELSGVAITPASPGASALAADGVSVGGALVQTTVANRPVRWTVVSGDLSVLAGNPSVPPGTATIGAGSQAGTFGLRAADSIYGNRQVDGSVRVAAVRLHTMSASPIEPVRARVTVVADPGGRIVYWRVDPPAVAAGVTVAPPLTGPGAAQSSVRVTCPVGFTGTVTVTATDSRVPAATASTTVRFRA